MKTVSPALLAICLIGNLAGAQEGEAPTADDVAKALANPNTPLASLKFNNQFRGFEGSLPDANGLSSFTMLFQPNFPFALESGASVFWRPAVPLISNQPVFNAATNQFDEQSGLGDIAFDLAYGRTTEDGILWATGIISSLPTAQLFGTTPWKLQVEFNYYVEQADRFGPEWMIGFNFTPVVRNVLASWFL